MTETNDENYQVIVFNFADQPVVIDALAPKLGEFPFESLPELAGIFRAGNPAIQKIEDPTGRLRPKFLELLECLVGDFIIPAHVWLLPQCRCDRVF